MVQLLEHVSLREYCSLKTGGAADFYARCSTPNDILEAIHHAKDLKLPARCIGQGSSLLASDSGFPGVVIHYQAQTLFFVHDKSQVIVDAGTPLNQLLGMAHSQGYSGLEFLIDMPGTIAGAVYNNKSRFGYQISEYIKSVTLLTYDGKESITSVDREWLNFGPNTSRLKEMRKHGANSRIPIIMSVTLQFSKMNYEACMQKIKHFRELQRDFPLPKGPSLQVFDCLSAKSIDPKQLAYRKRGDDTPLYYVDKSAVKQLRSVDIAVFGDNPNYVVNTKVGTSRDADQLIKNLQTLISSRYEAEITPVIEYLGLWG